MSKLRRRRFSPSYEAATKGEYLEKVAKGEKAWDHTLLAQGRYGVRFGQAPENQTKETKKTRATRWLDQEPPWEARTQSAAVRTAQRKGPSKVDKVKAAIDGYIKQTNAVGLLVPDTIDGLIAAGVPYREATELVGRAAKKLFLAGPDVVKLQPELATTFLRVLGGPLDVRYDGVLTVKTPENERPFEIRNVKLVPAQGEPKFLWSALRGKDIFAKFREQVQAEAGAYRKERDNPVFLQQLFSRWRKTLGTAREEDQVIVSMGVGNVAVERRFAVGEHSESRAGQEREEDVDYKSLKGVSLSALPTILVRLATRSSSMTRPKARSNPMPSDLSAFIQAEAAQGRFVAVPKKPGRVYWFSAKNGIVETTEARAKTWLRIAQAGAANRRFLATTPPLAESNPMGRKQSDILNDAWLDQYSQDAFGARQQIPVSRRNPARTPRQEQAASAMRLFRSGRAASLKEAWAMVRGGARSNPYFDATMTREALVPPSFPVERDFTTRYDVFARANGQEVRFTKNGQPFVVVNGRARFLKKSAVAKMNGDLQFLPFAGAPGVERKLTDDQVLARAHEQVRQARLAERMADAGSRREAVRVAERAARHIRPASDLAPRSRMAPAAREAYRDLRAERRAERLEQPRATFRDIQSADDQFLPFADGPGITRKGGGRNNVFPRQNQVPQTESGASMLRDRNRFMPWGQQPFGQFGQFSVTETRGRHPFARTNSGNVQTQITGAQYEEMLRAALKKAGASSALIRRVIREEVKEEGYTPSSVLVFDNLEADIREVVGMALDDE